MVNSNAKNLIKQVLSSGGTQGLLSAKDVGGTVRYIADFSAYPADVEDTFTLVAAEAGISVGSGSSTPVDSDYQLANTITSGLTGTVTSLKTIEDGNTSITYTISLTNTSGSDITISEIGYKQAIAASDSLNGTTATDRVFLLDRSLVDPLTISAGGQAVIEYKLKAVVTNGGGVLGNKTITANGTYRAEDDDLDGYSTVVVNVASAVLVSKSITENGTYDPQDDNADGYSSVTVNVSGGGGSDFEFTSIAEEGELNQGYATSSLILDGLTFTTKAEEGI